MPKQIAKKRAYRRRKTILLVVDLPFAPEGHHDFSDYLEEPQWASERDVAKAVHNAGYRPEFFGLYDNLPELIDRLRRDPVHLVFNLAESYANERDLEPHLPGVLELVGVPYTGCGAFALKICKDKALTKRLLSQAGVRVPAFYEIPRSEREGRSLRNLESVFSLSRGVKLIVKPLGLEASEGISHRSVVTNFEAVRKRARWIHEKYSVDALVEEYIEGRELYVGIMGESRPEVYPAREVFFENAPKGGLKFASYKAKWDSSFRKKWGIESYECDPIDEKPWKEIQRACRQMVKLFELRHGYARVDFRLTEDGKPYFLECNPNPSIAKMEDFALCADEGGYKYRRLIEKVIRLAEERTRSWPNLNQMV